MLDIDGVQLAQSNAILIYAGKLAGLYPWDPLAALKVEEFIGNKDDISLRCSNDLQHLSHLVQVPFCVRRVRRLTPPSVMQCALRLRTARGRFATILDYRVVFEMRHRPGSAALTRTWPRARPGTLSGTR